MRIKTAGAVMRMSSLSCRSVLNYISLNHYHQLSSHGGFTQESLKQQSSFQNIAQVLRDKWTGALKLIEIGL
jgi:hypothetical protein